MNTVLKAEKILKRHEIPFKLMPTPKKIALHCDISILFDESMMTNIQTILKNACIKAKGYYIKKGDDYAHYPSGQ
ncbi:MAG: DUF3343 domain-containing protein [Deltaproteobacteria bacterium]|nr:DUF3343 domain-containing protein [Deltaproteobacteria bacterium]